MSYAIMLLAHTRVNAGLADRVVEELVSKGHDNVCVSFVDGDPGAEDVLRSLANGGVDSVMVFPLTIAEGRLTVDVMPKLLGMPDNSCSYTYVEGRNVTIRFMTALGEDTQILETFYNRAVEAGIDPHCGVLVLSRGSMYSSNRRMADKLSNMFRERGFPNIVSCSMKHGNTSITDAVHELVSLGALSIIILPMFLSDCSYRTYLDSELGFSDRGFVLFQGVNIPVIVSRPLDFDQSLVDSIDVRIPEGW